MQPGKNDRGYKLVITGDSLRLETVQYKAQRESVLAKPLFGPETASLAFAALAAVGAMAIPFHAIWERLLTAAVAFSALFPVLRAFVFKPRELVFEIKGKTGMATLKMPFAKKTVFGAGGIKEIMESEEVLAPQNPNGYELVNKIALHHGTVIPDFAEKLDIHKVEILLKDGRRFVLYAGQDAAMAARLSESLRQFITKGKEEAYA
ncbi:MAG: hypothetical protein M0018_00220 [Nitrospiraceae bacterium]|nr:hypothetical protein [Nitrospiraceae bacterium]